MKKIIIAVDFTDQTEQVIDTGFEIAAKCGAEVILLHTEPPMTDLIYGNTAGPYGGMIGFGVDVPATEEIITTQLENDEKNLDSLKEKAEAQGLKVTTENFLGDTVSTILEQCHSHRPDLLVIGIQKKGFFSRLFCENSELSLVKKAPCPILLIPDNEG